MNFVLVCMACWAVLACSLGLVVGRFMNNGKGRT